MISEPFHFKIGRKPKESLIFKIKNKKSKKTESFLIKFYELKLKIFSHFSAIFVDFGVFLVSLVELWQGGCFLALFSITNSLFLAPDRRKFFIFSMETEKEEQEGQGKQRQQRQQGKQRGQKALVAVP